MKKRVFSALLLAAGLSLVLFGALTALLLEVTGKQLLLMELILDYYDKAGQALSQGVSIEKLAALPVRENIGRYKYVNEAEAETVFARTEGLLEEQLREELRRKEDD